MQHSGQQNTKHLRAIQVFSEWFSVIQLNTAKAFTCALVGMIVA